MTNRHLIVRSFALTLVFLCLIVFPILNERLGFVKDIKSFENRAMVKKPGFNVALLDPFPAKYDAYYNDHFPLRDGMIRTYSLFKIRALKTSPVPGSVIIGRNGWLFSAGVEQQDYLGNRHFPDSELEAFRLELEYRQNYLAKKNCKMYVMIAPVKAEIYPEYLPYEQYRITKESSGKQLIAYMNAHSFVKIIDVYDVLAEAKKKHDTYHIVDNHWNLAGGFYAANEVFRYIHKDFPKVKPLPVDSLTFTKTPLASGNLLLELGNLPGFKDYEYTIEPMKSKVVDNAGYEAPKEFAYPWAYETDRAVADSTLPRALIITDSFGESIFPYLAENFSRSVKLFDAWHYGLHEDIIDIEKPDVYILVIQEPVLLNFLLNQSRLKTQ